MDNVAILLSTYNGDAYLENQIESIQKQSFKNWRLYIRDDGSSDRTVNIIKKYCDSDSRIFFLNNNNNLGVVKSFLFLLTETNADYYMFCDQDDIWLESKIKNTLLFMKEKEKEVKKPYVIHTDLQVVDTNLNVQSTSMFEYQDIPKFRKNYISAFMRNNVTGCTMMINNQLKELVVKTDDIIMHDWWLSLIGSSFGEVCFCPNTDILYRQHGGNAVGAKKYGHLTYLVNRLIKIKEVIKGNKKVNYKKTRSLFLQANAFSSIYNEKLNESQKQTLESFLMLNKVSRIKRLKILMKNDIKMETILLTINFYIVVLLMEREDY